MLCFALLALTAAAAPSVDHRDIFKRPGPAPLDGADGLGPAPPAMQEDWDIQHYDIELVLDPVRREISGEITVTARARVEQPGELLLHATDPSIQAVERAGEATSYQHRGDEVRVEVPSGMSAGDELEVTVRYTAPGTTDGNEHGLHWGDPIYSFSEPEGARSWLVVYDAPADKATMTLQVVAPSDLFVVANGERLSVVDAGGDRQRWSFDFPWPIATYLIVVNAGDFEESVEDEGDVPVYTWASAADMRQAKTAFADTSAMITHLSELWVPYPYSHYGNALVPFGGAMEHTTATSFGEDLIWHGDYATLINVHELGHQWWGDYVTCASWEEIWLNEGFASYTEALWVEHAWGEEWLEYYVWEDQRASYMQWKEWEGEFALYDPDYMWGGTVYDKGSFVLHMLRFVMGDDAFFEGLRAYAGAFAHDVATTEDLQGIMEASHGDGLDWFFEQWVYRAGEPSYRVGLGNTQLEDGSWQVDIHIEQTSEEHWSMPVELLLGLEDDREVALSAWVEGAYTVVSTCLDQPATELEFSPHAHLLYGEVDTDHGAFGPAELVCGDAPRDSGDTGDGGVDDSEPDTGEGPGVSKGRCGCGAQGTPWLLLPLLSLLGASPWFRRHP
jgi:aminopeptidase N